MPLKSTRDLYRDPIAPLKSTREQYEEVASPLISTRDYFKDHTAGGLLSTDALYNEPCFTDKPGGLQSTDDLYDRAAGICITVVGGPVVPPGAHVPEDPVLSPVVGDKWFELGNVSVHTVDVDDWEITSGLTFTQSTGNMYLLVESKLGVNVSNLDRTWLEVENAPTHTVDADDWEIESSYTITSS